MPEIPSQNEITKRNKRWAYVIGAGLALFPLHNKWLTDITAIDGQATLFLPVLGTVIWLVATLLYLQENWKTMDWGDKRVYIPLLVIVAAMGLSGISVDSWGGKVAPLLMGISLFGLYLVARKLGKDLFFPLAVGAVIACLGVLAYAAIHPGKLTGGFVFERNYDILVGFVLLGSALFFHKYRVHLAVLALISLFFSGSPEGVFVVGILVVTIFIRRDWSKKLLIISGCLIILIAVWFTIGPGQTQYYFAFNAVRSDSVMNSSEVVHGVSSSSPVGYRYVKAAQAMSNIKPLGEGYNLTDFSSTFMVHNVPLVIVQQLGWPGIVAGLAWLWVVIWCLIKTKWKYVMVLVIALSVFDHYTWTQLGPWTWAIIGASTTGLNSDLLFRRAK